MKNVFYRILTVAVSLLAAISCVKDDDDRMFENIVGEWHWTGTESGQETDVYIAFSEDYRFELYQVIGDGAYRLYTGRFLMTGGCLSGVYDDGAPWASDYTTVFEGDSMTMTSTSVSGYSVRYEKKRIPDSVRNHCVKVTKSSGEPAVPFL